MTAENRTYITHLKVTDVPWHRLTTERWYTQLEKEYRNQTAG